MSCFELLFLVEMYTDIAPLFRLVDVVMMAQFNGKEREMDEWKKLFAAVDSRLTIKKVVKPRESVFSIMELVLE